MPCHNANEDSLDATTIPEAREQQRSVVVVRTAVQPLDGIEYLVTRGNLYLMVGANDRLDEPIRSQPPRRALPNE